MKPDRFDSAQSRERCGDSVMKKKILYIKCTGDADVSIVPRRMEVRSGTGYPLIRESPACLSDAQTRRGGNQERISASEY